MWDQIANVVKLSLVGLFLIAKSSEGQVVRPTSPGGIIIAPDVSFSDAKMFSFQGDSFYSNSARSLEEKISQLVNRNGLTNDPGYISLIDSAERYSTNKNLRKAIKSVSMRELKSSFCEPIVGSVWVVQAAELVSFLKCDSTPRFMSIERGRSGGTFSIQALEEARSSIERRTEETRIIFPDIYQEHKVLRSLAQIYNAEVRADLWLKLVATELYISNKNVRLFIPQSQSDSSPTQEVVLNASALFDFFNQSLGRRGFKVAYKDTIFQDTISYWSLSENRRVPGNIVAFGNGTNAPERIVLGSGVFPNFEVDGLNPDRTISVAFAFAEGLRAQFADARVPIDRTEFGKSFGAFSFAATISYICESQSEQGCLAFKEFYINALNRGNPGFLTPRSLAAKGAGNFSWLFWSDFLVNRGEGTLRSPMSWKDIIPHR